jgi:hypothetical protein
MPLGVNYKYYLGPWVWDTTEQDMPHWRAPAGTVGLVDLRSLPDQSITTLGDKPYGFFAVDGDALDSDYDLLGTGDCRDLNTNGSMQSAWTSLLGVTPSGDKLVDYLFDQLTDISDPTGDSPTRTLMPTVAGNLDLHLGGHSKVKTKRFNINSSRSEDKAYQDRFFAMKHAEYRKHRQDVIDGRMKPDQHLRVLDFWREQYGIKANDSANWKRLVPKELRTNHRGLVKHATTYTDDFNRSNETLSASANWSASLDATESEIVSNQLEATSNSSQTVHRYENDLSSADHYAQIDRLDSGTNLCTVAPSVRFDSSAETYYLMLWRSTSKMYKVVSGSYTVLDDTQLTDENTPRTYKVEIDGSALAGYADAVLDGSITDTAIAGNLRTGIWQFDHASTSIGDNFECADLSAGPTLTPLVIKKRNLVHFDGSATAQSYYQIGSSAPRDAGRHGWRNAMSSLVIDVETAAPPISTGILQQITNAYYRINN